MVAKLADKGKVPYGSRWVAGFYFIYLSLVAYASHIGFYDDVMLPPKIVIATTLPLAVFITFIYFTPICKRANTLLPLSSLVQIHIFRIVGSTFLVLLFFDLLPKPFALFAGIGDLVTALSSIIVASAIKQHKSYARRLTFLWNTFGLLDILGTSALAILFTKISIDQQTLGVEFLAEFPFCFIPAFAPPTIIFLHLLVYRKLSEKNSA